MSEDEELRMIRAERDALLKAVTELLDYVGITEEGSVPFKQVRERLSVWDDPDRVFCTCPLPGVAFSSSCPVKHRY